MQRPTDEWNSRFYLKRPLSRRWISIICLKIDRAQQESWSRVGDRDHNFKIYFPISFVPFAAAQSDDGRQIDSAWINAAQGKCCDRCTMPRVTCGRCCAHCDREHARSHLIPNDTHRVLDHSNRHTAHCCRIYSPSVEHVRTVSASLHTLKWQR